MRATFGATMVRVYAPECRELSVWENLVKAARDNGMGVIAQVWWGFGDVRLFSFSLASQLTRSLFEAISLAKDARFDLRALYHLLPRLHRPLHRPLCQFRQRAHRRLC